MIDNKRFKEVVIYLKENRYIRNQQDFTERVGSDKSTISQIINNRIMVPNILFGKIGKAFPFINIAWLLTGKGEMLNPTEKKNTVAISPNAVKEGVYTGTLVYDIDATCGVESRDIYFAEDNVIGSIDLPEISKSSRIIRANGDSMEPRICDGNRVVIREIMSWSDIFYGQIYLIIMEEYRMIKYIRRYEADEENYIILRSENPKYDDIKLHKSKILKLFIVENILSVRNQL